MTTSASIIDALQQFRPDPDALLRTICPHITDDMLQQIAKADYGQDVECHLAELRTIRDTAMPPVKMEWCPSEVLELTRSSGGGWIGAFSCAVLLRALSEPSNYDMGGNEILVNFILNARELPIDLNVPTASFLAWLLLHCDLEGQDKDVCAYGIGLLWFAPQNSNPVPDNVLMALAEWVRRRAIELYPELILDGERLPARMGVGNPPPSGWQQLGGLFCELDLSRRSQALREAIEEIGLQLAE